MKKTLLSKFYVLELIERIAARLQGKGYGSSSINKEVASISKLLKLEPGCALDIGGNVGNYSHELSRLWKNMDIHIFEPSPTNIKKLKSRFQDNSKIHIHPFAVSDFEGSTTLYADKPGSGMGSLSHRDLNHLGVTDFNNQEQINVVRMDEFWKKLLGGGIDIVKLDIEGHELNALKGFGNLIDDVKIIQFEFGGCNIDTRTYFKDFYNFFKEKDYTLYRITPIGVEPILKYRESDEFFSTINYIALNKRFI